MKASSMTMRFANANRTLARRRVHAPPAAFCLMFFIALSLPAQDFGFGFGDEAEAGGLSGGAAAPSPAVKVGGEAAAELLAYVDDFDSEEDLKKASLGDVFSGSLFFSASGANADAVFKLNLSGPVFADMAAYTDLRYTPAIINEAYLRVFFGPLTVEGGYRKLTWGKADSLGPLDVVNPLDYSDLTGITDIMAIKIARPMVHLFWDFGANTKLAAVFVPAFQGHTFAAEGRWVPRQVTELPGGIYRGMLDMIPAGLLSGFQAGIDQGFKDLDAASLTRETGGLEYAQTGLRFTTTLGPADFGAQYYYGNFFRPDVAVKGAGGFKKAIDDLAAAYAASMYPGSGTAEALAAAQAAQAAADAAGKLSPAVAYNRYHQIGVDYAQVLFDFNVRAEFAVHITGDLAGDDGAVKNPFLAWSLGFDRDIFWGINANIQCNETIRLLNDNIIDNPALDTEAGTDPTSTRITLKLSKKFLRDDLEFSFANIWDIEFMDLYLIPGITWNIKDVTAEVSAGIFTGKAGGELSQYHRNNFIRTGVSYSF
jgi:hypothetical protein